MILAKLALSNFITRKVRVGLTLAAIALSVSLVVSVTSGYASVESAVFKFLMQYMGSHDGQLTRSGDLRGGIRENICDELLADPDVKTVVRRLETESGMVDASGKTIIGRRANLYGIVMPGDSRVENMEMESGAWFAGADGDGAVIDQAAARIIKTGDPKDMNENGPTMKVGDTFAVPGFHGNLTLRVVGIVHKPGILASVAPSIYLPLHTLQHFVMPDQPPQVTRAMIDLRDSVDATQFANRWRAKLAVEDPLVKLRLSSESKTQLDQNLQSVRMLSYLGGVVSMIAATFIVFSALSMGVAERQRTLAMLRAIGAFRGQLGVLVTLEGLALACCGVSLGVPLGLFWTKIIIWRFPEIFAAGMTISWGGLLLASVGSIGAALLASFLPAWSAMRVSPLEAMNPLATKPSSATMIPWALLGIVFISIDPFILFGPLSRTTAFYGHFALGLPGVMIGFFLMAPVFVWVIERVVGPVVAVVFGVRYAILRQQLSGGIWRAAGTCAALMVGLAILTVLQTQGNSMLKGWQLPTHFPDIFLVSEKMDGLNAEEQKQVEAIPSIKDGEIMPIAIASPEFGNNPFAIMGATIMPNATMFLGIDPDKAFKMMELNFLQGDAKSAAAMLKQGHHLVVTQEYHEIKGLNVGDMIPLKTIHGIVNYTIAAIVWSPGIDLFVNTGDLGRLFDQRTAATVFGTLDDARRDFGVSGIYLFAANLNYFTDREDVLKQVKQSVGNYGMRAGDVRHIKAMIEQTFARILLLVSTVAFCAMAVAALGVTNTIMASIRSRRWQFGVLRSIGVTRDELLWLVLAEALLLGIVGVALGLTAGMEMSIDAHQFGRLVLGYAPPTVVPWKMISIGSAIVLGISLLASIIPATSVARTEPLELLQAGRAAM